MRRTIALLVPLLLVLLAPARTTQAAWVDTASVTDVTVTAAALSAPVITCGPMPGNSSAVRLSWSPSTSPAPLTYDARIVGSPDPAQAVTGYVDITPALLASLLGHSVTVRVTGRLPGTLWSVSSDRVVNIGLLGLTVYC